MSEDDSCYLWLFLGLLEINQEDLHEIAEHGGDAYFSSSKINGPLQNGLQLLLFEESNQ